MQICLTRYLTDENSGPLVDVTSHSVELIWRYCDNFPSGHQLSKAYRKGRRGEIGIIAINYQIDTIHLLILYTHINISVNSETHCDNKKQIKQIVV